MQICVYVPTLFILYFVNRYREDTEVFKEYSSIPESKSSMNYIWLIFKVAFNLNKSKYPSSCSQKMALCSLFCTSKYAANITLYASEWSK